MKEQGIHKVKVRLLEYFFAGLAILVPIAVIVIILVGLYNLVQPVGLSLLEKVFRHLGMTLPLISGLMTLLSIIVVTTLVGWFISSIIGRMVKHWLERIIQKIPVIRIIYSSVKLVVEMILQVGTARANQGFKKVAIVEYPSPGIWQIGFVSAELNKRQRSEGIVSVIIPFYPNPITGNLVFVDRHKVKILDISSEKALQIIVSAGVSTPQKVLEDILSEINKRKNLKPKRGTMNLKTII